MTFQEAVTEFGSLTAVYDAVLDGKVNAHDAYQFVDMKQLAEHRQARALERIAPFLEQIAAHLAHPVITVDPAQQYADAVTRRRTTRDTKPAVTSLIPTRCDECNGVVDHHTANCPIGKKNPKALTHAEAMRPEEHRG